MNALKVFSNFFIFLIFAMCFKMIISKTDKKSKKELDDYIREERDSLFSRRCSIDDSLFLKPDISTFPIVEYDDIHSLSDELKKISAKQNAVIKKAESKMLCLKGLSNLELKRRFGVANLESIASYEQNYQKFSFVVFEWADSLNKAGLTDSAIAALEALLNFGSSYSKNFMLLADLYFDKKDFQKLEDLLPKLSSLDILMQERIKNYISDYINYPHLNR